MIYNGARALIIDDSMFMRGMLGNMLTEHGYMFCYETDNGLEAIFIYDMRSVR